MIESLTSKPIPNKAAARAVHAQLRANGVSHYEFGVFYRSLLARQLWLSQTSLAEFFGVSVSNLSRMIALTRIPSDVVRAVGGPQRISYRVGDLLLDTIDNLGELAVVVRAREAAALGYHAIDDVLEYIVTNRTPRRDLTKVRVRLGRDKKTLRVEIAQLDRLVPHLPKLETFLSTALLMFEASLMSEAAANAATVASGRRRRRPSVTKAAEVPDRRT